MALLREREAHFVWTHLDWLNRVKEMRNLHCPIEMLSLCLGLEELEHDLLKDIQKKCSFSGGLSIYIE